MIHVFSSLVFQVQYYLIFNMFNVQCSLFNIQDTIFNVQCTMTYILNMLDSSSLATLKSDASYYWKEADRRTSLFINI